MSPCILSDQEVLSHQEEQKATSIAAALSPAGGPGLRGPSASGTRAATHRPQRGIPSQAMPGSPRRKMPLKAGGPCYECHRTSEYLCRKHLYRYLCLLCHFNQSSQNCEGDRTAAMLSRAAQADTSDVQLPCYYTYTSAHSRTC